MFRALNAHLQEGTLYTCSVWNCHSLRELKLCTDSSPRTLVESDSTIRCMYTVYSPEDEHLRVEKCRGT